MGTGLQLVNGKLDDKGPLSSPQFERRRKIYRTHVRVNSFLALSELNLTFG